jgi:hypothetical protein
MGSCAVCSKLKNVLFWVFLRRQTSDIDNDLNTSQVEHKHQPEAVNENSIAVDVRDDSSDATFHDYADADFCPDDDESEVPHPIALACSKAVPASDPPWPTKAEFSVREQR